MGHMRFLIAERERVSPLAIERAYVAGLDGTPTPARKIWESETLLRIEREIDESGDFHILWDVQDYGPLLLSTASLMERPQPYQLTIELARGTVNRLRSKAAVWQMAGLQLSGEVTDKIRSAVVMFIGAATAQHDPGAAAALAEETIRSSLDAMTALTQQYADQVMRFRHDELSPLNTLLVGNLGAEPLPPNTEPMFDAAFNAAVIPLHWRSVQPDTDGFRWMIPDRQLQSCLRHRLKIIAGPLIRLDVDFLPDSVIACCPAFERLAARMRQYIEAVVRRYRGQVHLWHCAATGQLTGPLPLSDEQRLRLSVMAIQMTHRLDPRTPVIISFDQPWGEYQVDERSELPPMHLAEMLVRADIGLAGIALEMNLGYWPAGSLPRDLLEIGQLIDQWSLLGLPLIPLLCIPSGAGPDPLASPRVGRPLGFSSGQIPSFPNQKWWVDQLLPVLIAKQSVQAVVWNQVFDSVPHRFAHGGLFDAGCRPKPSLSSIIALRRDHLA